MPMFFVWANHCLILTSKKFPHPPNLPENPLHPQNLPKKSPPKIKPNHQTYPKITPRHPTTTYPKTPTNKRTRKSPHLPNLSKNSPTPTHLKTYLKNTPTNKPTQKFPCPPHPPTNLPKNSPKTIGACFTDSEAR